jgi:hypothetical protein
LQTSEEKDELIRKLKSLDNYDSVDAEPDRPNPRFPAGSYTMTESLARYVVPGQDDFFSIFESLLWAREVNEHVKVFLQLVTNTTATTILAIGHTISTTTPTTT